MRWLCSLVVSVAAAAQSSPAQHLQFDLAAIPATRDSFVFLLRGEPRGFAVWQYEIRAAAVTNLAPGDSLTVPVYREFEDTVVTVSLVAGQPTAVQVPAGRFDVLPIKNEDFVLYVTRAAPRRVVKGETADKAFSFQLAH